VPAYRRAGTSPGHTGEVSRALGTPGSWGTRHPAGAARGGATPVGVTSSRSQDWTHKIRLQLNKYIEQIAESNKHQIVQNKCHVIVAGDFNAAAYSSDRIGHQITPSQTDNIHRAFVQGLKHTYGIQPHKSANRDRAHSSNKTRTPTNGFLSAELTMSSPLSSNTMQSRYLIHTQQTSLIQQTSDTQTTMAYSGTVPFLC